jgi:hypothetical protein
MRKIINILLLLISFNTYSQIEIGESYNSILNKHLSEVKDTVCEIDYAYITISNIEETKIFEFGDNLCIAIYLIPKNIDNYLNFYNNYYLKLNDNTWIYDLYIFRYYLDSKFIKIKLNDKIK